MYTFHISTEPLADGRFQPTLELKEEMGGKPTFHQYVILGTYDSHELSLEHARKHALDEAQKMGLDEEDFQIVTS